MDVMAVSWGLTSVGEGKAAFVDSQSREARALKQQSQEKASNRNDSVTNEWMKRALLTCGLIAVEASIKKSNHG